MTRATQAYERFLQSAHKMVYAVDRGADRLLKERFNASFSQFMVLMAIDCCTKPSQQDIAQFMDLTPAAVSRQIDALVKSGSISRKPDPENRRSHMIALTPKGKSRMIEMKQVLLSSFASSVDIPDSELTQASELLEKVASIIHPESPRITK